MLENIPLDKRVFSTLILGFHLMVLNILARQLFGNTSFHYCQIAISLPDTSDTIAHSIRHEFHEEKIVTLHRGANILFAPDVGCYVVLSNDDIIWLRIT